MELGLTKRECKQIYETYHKVLRATGSREVAERVLKEGPEVAEEILAEYRSESEGSESSSTALNVAPELRKRIILMREKGVSYSQISKELNLSKEDVIFWANQYHMLLKKLKSEEEALSAIEDGLTFERVQRERYSASSSRTKDPKRGSKPDTVVEIVRLRDEEGMSFVDISKRFSLPRKAVIQVYRAFHEGKVPKTKKEREEFLREVVERALEEKEEEFDVKKLVNTVFAIDESIEEKADKIASLEGVISTIVGSREFKSLLRVFSAVLSHWKYDLPYGALSEFSGYDRLTLFKLCSIVKSIYL
jgi:DNA-directed RNA polymerase specialized sigma24 family protein